MINLKELIESGFSVISKNKKVYIAEVGTPLIKRYEVRKEGKFSEIYKDSNEAIKTFKRLANLND